MKLEQARMQRGTSFSPLTELIADCAGGLMTLAVDRQNNGRRLSGPSRRRGTC